MNVVLEASHGTIELATALRTAPRRLREVMRTEAAWLGNELVKTAQNEYRNAPQTTPTATRAPSGMLRRSYTASQPQDTGQGVTFDFGVLQAGAQGNALQYAAVHEFGATIHAKPGRWLTIPIGPESNAYTDAISRGRSAMTGAGVLRAGAGNVGNLFRGRGSLNPDVLYQRQGDGIMPMFLLRKKVTIPARPALLPSAAQVLPTWMERYATALDKASTEAGS